MQGSVNMGHPHPTIESTLLTYLLAPSSAFAIAFLFLVFQFIFKIDFKCQCDAYNKVYCLVYLIVPFCGLTGLLTLSAKTSTICAQRYCQRKCKSSCCVSQSDGPRRGDSSVSQSTCICSCCKSWACRRVVYKQILRTVFISSIWIITVLIDGDALVCWNLTNANITDWYDQIPCKEPGKLTAEESKSIKYYEFISQVTGLVLLFAMPIIWALISNCCVLCKTPLKSLYEDVHEEETIMCLEEEMRNMVKTRAKKKSEDIFNKHKNWDNVNWTKFSNELIDLIIEDNPASLSHPFSAAYLESSSANLPSSANTESSSATRDPSSANPEPSSYTKDPSSANPEPSLATADPSLANLEPSSANPEPSSYTPEPLSANPEPSSYTPEPSSANPEPSSATTDPSSATTDPSSATTDPSLATADPSSANPEPSSANPEPSSATTDPSSATADPSLANPEPSSAQREPSSTNLPQSTQKLPQPTQSLLQPPQNLP